MTEGYAHQSEHDHLMSEATPGMPGSSGSMPTAGMESIQPLVAGLTHDLNDMIRDQIKLARAELREEAMEAGKGAAAIGAGGITGLIGVTFLVHGIAELLSKRLPRWASFGLVGLGLAATAGSLGMSGKDRLMSSKLKPQQTIASLKETKRWLRRETGRA